MNVQPDDHKRITYLKPLTTTKLKREFYVIFFFFPYFFLVKKEMQFYRSCKECMLLKNKHNKFVCKQEYRHVDDRKS